MNRLLYSLLVVMVMCGCATTYKPILPNQLNYDMDENEVGVNFGYRYEVLNYRGNRKYAKHERKKMIRVVAVKIENNTDVPLKLGENFNI